jgi:TonB family protein
MSFLGALLLAASVASVENDIENPRFVSPNGEYIVVIRQLPGIGDFERVNKEEFYRRDEVQEWLDEVPLPKPEVELTPKKPEPVRGAIYRVWPGDHRELLGEIELEENESYEFVMVSNEGFVVTRGLVQCGAAAALVTIRAPGGNVVRRVPVRDAMTAHDQQWLCRGDAKDVRFAFAERSRLSMFVADDQCKDDEVEIDLETGTVTLPARNRCPAALLVIPRAEDAGGQWMLDQAIARVEPEYPDVATKARISGLVTARVVARADGRVESVTIVKPLPFGMDQAVKTALAQWELPPSESPVTGSITYRFELVRHVRLVTTSCH